MLECFEQDYISVPGGFFFFFFLSSSQVSVFTKCSVSLSPGNLVVVGFFFFVFVFYCSFSKRKKLCSNVKLCMLIFRMRFK